MRRSTSKLVLGTPERSPPSRVTRCRAPLLLSGDESTVADGEGFEQAALDVVGASLIELILDPERHDLLADEGVAEVLLDVGEPGDGFAIDQVGAV